LGLVKQDFYMLDVLPAVLLIALNVIMLLIPCVSKAGLERYSRTTSPKQSDYQDSICIQLPANYGRKVWYRSRTSCI